MSVSVGSRESQSQARSALDHGALPRTVRSGGIVLERKARSTGTRVYLEYAPDADAEQPWLTVCDDHGGVCSHETRALAATNRKDES